ARYGSAHCFGNVSAAKPLLCGWVVYIDVGDGVFTTLIIHDIFAKQENLISHGDCHRTQSPSRSWDRLLRSPFPVRGNHGLRSGGDHFPILPAAYAHEREQRQASAPVVTGDSVAGQR